MCHCSLIRTTLYTVNSAWLGEEYNFFRGWYSHHIGWLDKPLHPHITWPNWTPSSKIWEPFIYAICTFNFCLSLYKSSIWLQNVKKRRLQPYIERSSRPGSEPSSVKADVYVWHYALLAVHARKEEEDFSYPLENRSFCKLEWGFLHARCPSCHPTRSVRALKGTQNTNPNQWPGLILTSSTTGLLTDGSPTPGNTRGKTDRRTPV